MEWDKVLTDLGGQPCLKQIEGTENYVATLGCVPAVIIIILNAATSLAGVIAVFFVIWGGFKYLRSGGDPKQADAARQTITYAIIGLVLVLASYFLLSVFSNFVGVECLRYFDFTTCQTGPTPTP